MIVAETFPTFGTGLRSLLLALIALNETMGAVLFRRALVAAGEVAEGVTVVHEAKENPA
jgi:hypothetical protein